MIGVFIAACVAAGSFLAAVLVHLWICRAAPSIDRLRLLFRLLPVMLACTALTTLAVQHVLVPAVREDMAAVCIAFAAVTLCMLFVGALSFYSAITHSVRLHIASLISHSPGSRRTFRELESLYGADAATRQRAQQLVMAGYLQNDGKLLRLTPKGAVYAGISSAGKRLFRIGRGG
jgi:hypothetical protein